MKEIERNFFNGKFSSYCYYSRGGKCINNRPRESCHSFTILLVVFFYLLQTFLIDNTANSFGTCWCKPLLNMLQLSLTPIHRFMNCNNLLLSLTNFEFEYRRFSRRLSLQFVIQRVRFRAEFFENHETISYILNLTDNVDTQTDL